MKKLFMAVIALMMMISASAQFYIYFSDGTVAKVDSISMVAPSQGIGSFSVSATKQVTFSPGNLQYHPSNDKWRFAENQWAYVGDSNEGTVYEDGVKCNNALISPSYNGWIDLFGWGTGNNPTITSYDNSDYSTFVDWGTNKIGDDAPNTWRTLTADEWNYLLNNRNNASSLRGVAQVNGVNSLIFLPDNWTCPAGVTFKSGFHSNYAAYQTFTAEQWSQLEAAGAVILPAAGSRRGSGVRDVQGYGGYWSATENNSNYAYYLFFGFYSGEADVRYYDRYLGHSVRLVKDLQ